MMNRNAGPALTAAPPYLGPKVAITGDRVSLPPPPSWSELRRRYGPRLAGVQVLLVDDEPVSLALTRGQLETLGMTVHTATDGEAALRALHASRAQVVLMDCDMPVLDGAAATRRLRLDARWRSLPVVACTGSSDAASRLAALQAGMDGLVDKPCDPEALCQALVAVLPEPSPAAAETR